MLTSVKNPWVKSIRKLQQTKYRRSQQQFLVEGTHLVQEALATRYPLHSVCATERWQVHYPQLWDQLQATTERQETVSPEVLAAIATTKTPDGVVAIAAHIPPPAPTMAPSLGLVLEELQDPGNVGTLIRTAAAVGCSGLWLTADSVDATHPKVLRASSGQWFRTPLHLLSDLSVQFADWQQQGSQVIATAATGAMPYWKIDLTMPTVLVLGNEGAGLSEAAIAAADHVVAIPMHNGVESINVGVAAAVILFEAARQRHMTP